MIYNVAQLLKSPVGADNRAEIEGTVSLNSDDAAVIEPIIGEVRLQHMNQGILAAGECDTTVQLQCVRCLENYEMPLHMEFSDVYLPTIDVVTGRSLPHSDDDDAFPIDDHHHLDLSDGIRQGIILALPMQPLCREDCAGLCSVCGNNRNVKPCTCEAQADARWIALAALSLELPDESMN